MSDNLIKKIITAIVDLNYRMLFLLLFCLLVLAFLSGQFFGKEMKKGFISGESKFYLLFKSPELELSRLYNYLNGENIFRRISAYYGLSERRMVEKSFLFDRFDRERNDLTKVVIFEILVENFDENSMVNFIELRYVNQEKRLKEKFLYYLLLNNYNDFDKLKIRKKIIERAKLKLKKDNQNRFNLFHRI